MEKGRWDGGFDFDFDGEEERNGILKPDYVDFVACM
jgi:hypothetical protein